ncbi:hypothetical protein AYL99_01790 [Fonsecaea erecta]|uniref:Uncharacterized protein n=1 Tax=Fonsecaea erecta TaxID=1367422 RepID=A0A178ZTQ0_9EURO|nr:hypothetical protein AYL99_01790 [Fonsecaea erecta]OAP62563.1 hypothetical protein AYL99_01790 [Fonsecaea erecta]
MPPTTGPQNMCTPPRIAYADLMKPDEDWRGLRNTAERRKIQNRIAQRAYRRNAQRKAREVEELRKQLRQCQQGKGPNSPPASPWHCPSEPWGAANIEPQQMTPGAWSALNDRQGSASTGSPSSPPKLPPSSSVDASGYPIPYPSPVSSIQKSDCQNLVQMPPITADPRAGELFFGEPTTLSSSDTGFLHGLPDLTIPTEDLNFTLPWAPSTRNQSKVATPEPVSNTAPLLHMAVAGNHSDVISVLLQDAEISVNEKDNAGFTPLQLAVMLGRTQIVSQLLEYGADVKCEEP